MLPPAAAALDASSPRRSKGGCGSAEGPRVRLRSDLPVRIHYCLQWICRHRRRIGHTGWRNRAGGDGFDADAPEMPSMWWRPRRRRGTGHEGDKVWLLASAGRRRKGEREPSMEGRQERRWSGNECVAVIWISLRIPFRARDFILPIGLPSPAAAKIPVKSPSRFIYRSPLRIVLTSPAPPFATCANLLKHRAVNQLGREQTNNQPLNIRRKPGRRTEGSKLPKTNVK